MSEHIERMITMLGLIPRYPRRVTVEGLIDQLQERGFAVGNRRMIERNLHELSGSPHFPLQCDGHKPAGWSWGASAQALDIPCMDSHTALTFMLARQFLQPLLPRSTRRYLEPHFDKAGAVLDVQRGRKLSAWPDKIHVLPKGQQLRTPEVADGIIEVVYTALLEERRFEARYQKRGGAEPKQYVVDPLGLVFRNDQIYLVCCVAGRDKAIQLVLHRMQQATLLEAPRRVPANFNLQRYVAGGAFRYGDRVEDIELRVRFGSELATQLQETPLSADQHLVDDGPEHKILCATVASDWQLERWLLSFGDKAVVLAPDWLRQRIIEITQCMVQRYADARAVAD